MTAKVSKKNSFSTLSYQVLWLGSGIRLPRTIPLGPKMQKRKKFLFAKYWVSDTAEKIAVGFNCVTGKLTFNNPASYSSFAPSPNGAWKSFKSTLNDQIHDFVYTEVNASRIPILKSWCNASDKIYLCLPKINIATSIGDHVYKLEYPTKDVLQSMYNLPAKLACVPLNSLTGKVFASIEKKITPKEAQGGLSVAGGCRCLTKELDMIAC